MAYDREKARAQLLTRTNEAYDRREGGVNYKYFKEDTGILLWSAKPTKDNSHIIDILPFTVGKNYPLLDGRKVICEGDYAYKLDLEVHRNIGPAKLWIICPAKNYGLPCPICEDISARSAIGEDWGTLKSVATQRRCAFNVLVYDGKNENKVQVWEASHKYSDKAILMQAKSPRTGGIEPFSDPDIGKSISFEVANDEYNTHQGHKLLPRDYTIPEEILDKVYILDQEIIIMSYDKIANIYFVDAPKTEERVATETRRPPQQETTREEVKNKCPHEYLFGDDIDRKPECGTCKTYDNCAAEADIIAAARKAKRTTANETDTNQPAETTSEKPAETVAGQRRLRRPQE